ncbi:GcrA family cell cycle regulator [Acuticoccus sp. MNP-M23]|uniref:GcrA family cell cycle regulator n=1 Tax=Acuticoccus sp. MNP-M23 TaxID=3072793 RepID=UPI00281605A9|nr:GcrA family cell cycle regulator [Acuticoccus sp. MNP-M23]WMS44201.1 GcrA family cell cycle regulator [Acuticoccus sp. MNP-M23]
MSWTDERIEQLRKLWAEGHSASQIAGTMGGVTRNAVIGKIHRLGLSGRVKTARPAARRAAPAPATVSPAAAAAAVRTPKPAAQPRVMAAGAAAVKVVEREVFEPAPVPQHVAEVVPLRGGITLTDLSASTCRWPIGDPSGDNFSFCGARSEPGDTYCTAHADVAFPGRTNKPRKPTGR